jgi:hypothetical protein
MLYGALMLFKTWIIAGDEYATPNLHWNASVLSYLIN